MRQTAKRLAYAVAPDAQTIVLLRSGAHGIAAMGRALSAGWGGWTSRGGSAAGIPQPAAFPSVDLTADDPVAAILAAPEFAAVGDFFAKIDQAERALVSAVTQALLYTLVRNQRPDHVIEIGTYRASTSKALCRALAANGRGVVDTVDPANGGAILRLLRRWPAALRERVCYYPMSSMDFFNLAVFRQLTSDLVFVDGNHDYEYALFDIQSAARLVRPGGFIAIDNISQAGPFFAAVDFMKAHPAWHECGDCLATGRTDAGFDLRRSTIPETDLCVIRAPANHMIGARPQTAGPQKVAEAEVHGIELAVAQPARGTLRAQFVVRVREPVMSEDTTETSVTLDHPRGHVGGPVRVPLGWAFAPEHMRLERTIELWLSWSGAGELELSRPPTLF
ncbi:MAG TPA: class I SAM-dependent methyltransferase [Stellaceae bacterium]|nr:class I SAM-dependent methyltransferase [Stellaceae bacterium]